MVICPSENLSVKNVLKDNKVTMTISNANEVQPTARKIVGSLLMELPVPKIIQNYSKLKISLPYHRPDIFHLTQALDRPTIQLSDKLPRLLLDLNLARLHLVFLTPKRNQRLLTLDLHPTIYLPQNRRLTTMSDYLFRGSLEDLDPNVYELTQLEAERQYRKLILIPSELTC